MKKVLVIGSGGAGKSTFSRKLGEKTNLEVIHLDRLYWKPNWIEPEEDKWRETIRGVLKRDSWVMDGNYSGTLEMRAAASDTIIFLDLPRTICLRRVLKRITLSYGRTRADMAEGCNEKFDLEFLKWVWNYRTRTKPKVEALLESVEKEKTIIRLKSAKEVENFLLNSRPLQ
ncbi:MAG TPA: DNA topology modulation protein [Pyrinomonadaceae bacterium]|jgi:adenylate kinase family enzyme